MAEYLEIIPGNIRPEHAKIIDGILNKDGVIAYPTDSGYALGCLMESSKAQKTIQEIRGFDKTHNFTLMCKDLSEIALYSHIDTPAYRFLKRYTPGAFTFILKATNLVPKLMQNKAKKTIGIRVSEHQVPRDLGQIIRSAFLTASLILPGETSPLTNADDIESNLGEKIDLILDCHYCGYEPTTVLDLTETPAKIIRQGAGIIEE